MVWSYSWKRKKRSILEGTPSRCQRLPAEDPLNNCWPIRGFAAVDISRSDREYEPWYARKKVSRWQPLWREIYDAGVVAQVESWTPLDKLSLTFAKTSPIVASPLPRAVYLGNGRRMVTRQTFVSNFARDANGNGYKRDCPLASRDSDLVVRYHDSRIRTLNRKEDRPVNVLAVSAEIKTLLRWMTWQSFDLWFHRNRLERR